MTVLSAQITSRVSFDDADTEAVDPQVDAAIEQAREDLERALAAIPGVEVLS